VSEEGPCAPRLVIVGVPWRDTEFVLQRIARSAALERAVIPVSGLTTPALRRLVSGASALLMPSLAEGFGLPIVEALARGVPAIASDLPAHRETGGAFVTYVDARDAEGWLAAVRDHWKDPEAPRRRLAGYAAWTWKDYIARVEPFVDAVGRQAPSIDATAVARSCASTVA
jgi:glycosyltransferase involved in cell wall biosynthesis